MFISDDQQSFISSDTFQEDRSKPSDCFIFRNVFRRLHAINNEAHTMFKQLLSQVPLQNIQLKVQLPSLLCVFAFLSLLFFQSCDLSQHILTPLTLLILSSSLLSSRLHASAPSPACDLSPLFHSSSFPLSRHCHICQLVNQGLLSVLNTSSSGWPPKKHIHILSLCFPVVFFYFFLIISYCLFSLFIVTASLSLCLLVSHFISQSLSTLVSIYIYCMSMCVCVCLSVC